MKALCSRCGYRCETRSFKEACPYCGERNTLMEIQSAEDLVDRA